MSPAGLPSAALETAPPLPAETPKQRAVRLAKYNAVILGVLAFLAGFTFDALTVTLADSSPELGTENATWAFKSYQFSTFVSTNGLIMSVIIVSAAVLATVMQAGRDKPSDSLVLAIAGTSMLAFCIGMGLFIWTLYSLGAVLTSAYGHPSLVHAWIALPCIGAIIATILLVVSFQVR